MLVDPAAPVGDHKPDLPGHTRANVSHPSIVPLFRQIQNNFVLGTYNTLFDIDTDDGSGYLQAHNNFFVYGGGGLKSFFGGRWQHHWQNVYGYVGDNGCFWAGPNIAFFDNYCVGMSRYPSRFAGSFDPVTGCPLDNPLGDTMFIQNNTILTPNGARVPTCKGISRPFPPDAELLQRGERATAPFPKPAL
jgi:hypothetical protein